MKRCGEGVGTVGHDKEKKNACTKFEERLIFSLGVNSDT